MGPDISKTEEGETHGCCQRNRLSICLGVILALALAFLALSYLGLVGGEFLQSEAISICDEAECIKSSGEIYEFIDDSVDPCEDFHQFVCGKFSKTAYEKQISNLLEAEQQRIQHQIDALIVDPISEDDIKPVRMQKKFFQTCLDKEEMDKNGGNSFQELLKNFIDYIRGGHFLTSGNWGNNDFNWMDAMVKARQQGMPFDWFLRIDLHENEEEERYDLKITYPESCDFFRNHNIDDYEYEYINMMSITASVLNIKLEREIQSIFNFIKKFTKICNKKSQVFVTKLNDLEYNNLWFKQGMKSLPFIKSITGQGNRWHGESQIAYDGNIIRLDDLLNNTEKKVQAGYVVWRIMEYFAPYLSRPVREAYKNFTEMITGESMSRFQFCLQATKSRFQFVSETVNVRSYDRNISEEATELFYSIREELVSQIEETEWLDNETKQANLDFFEDLDEILGGTDDMYEDTIFTDYLHIGQMSSSSANIITMLTELSQTSFFAKMKMIGYKFAQPSLATALEASAQHLIAVDETKKQLFVPATMFHGLLYNPNNPKYLNYAGLGSTIARELAHGLIQMTNNPTSKQIKTEENKECLRNSITGAKNHRYQFLQMNRTASIAILKEIRPIILGQDIGYKAYQNWVEENGEEPHLVGLDYSPNQLFWIKSSLNHCYRPLPEDDSAVPEAEEIFKQAIIQGVKNSQYFAADFECPLGMPMNPETKCEFF